MQYGQLYTAWTRALGEAGLEKTKFDFAQRWDEAQLFLAKALPPAAVPELMAVTSALGAGPSIINLASGVIEVHGVEIVPDIAGATRFRRCRLVSPEDFAAWSVVSIDPLATRRGSSLFVSPAAKVQGGNAQVRMTLKYMPTLAISPAAMTNVCALLRGTISSSNRRLFNLAEPSSLFVPPATYIGARAYLAKANTAEYLDLTSFWDTIIEGAEVVNGVTQLTVRDETNAASAAEYFAMTVVPHHNTTGSLSYPQDTASPAPWTAVWHPIILDYALYKEFARTESVDRAVLHLNRFNQALQMMGVNLQVGRDA